MEKSGSAVWTGDLKTGQGTVSTETSALRDAPYGFQSRFESGPGTNPEELLGAAHAACFSMALAMLLGNEKLVPESIETQADVTLDKDHDGYAITAIHLTVHARIADTDQASFERIADQAKHGCPVSKLFKGANITMDATLDA